MYAKRWFSPYYDQVGVPVAPAMMRDWDLSKVTQTVFAVSPVYTSNPPVAHKREDNDFRESGERNNETPVSGTSLSQQRASIKDHCGVAFGYHYSFHSIR